MTAFVEPCNPPIMLGDTVAMLLRLVAIHDGVSEHQFISRAVIARAEQIGLPALADCKAFLPPLESERGGGKACHREPSRCLGPP